MSSFYTIELWGYFLRAQLDYSVEGKQNQILFTLTLIFPFSIDYQCYIGHFCSRRYLNLIENKIHLWLLDQQLAELLVSSKGMEN